MVKKILIGLAVAAAALAAIISMQPAGYSIARSATMGAPPAKVFALVNNIRRYNDWSPWARMDPSQAVTFEGPESGVGATQKWQGKKTGTGRMTCVSSEPDRRIVYRLEVRNPMASTADMAFEFQPEAIGTRVTWSISGRKNFISKAFSLVMNMDTMMGGHFERGLESMKAIVEHRSR